MSALSLSTSTQSLDDYERQLLPLITEWDEQNQGCCTYTSSCCLAVACFVKGPFSWVFATLGCLGCCCGGITGAKNIYKACDKSPQPQVDRIFEQARDLYFKQRRPVTNSTSKIELELRKRRELLFSGHLTNFPYDAPPLVRDIQQCKAAIQNNDPSPKLECDIDKETQRLRELYHWKWVDAS